MTDATHRIPHLHSHPHPAPSVSQAFTPDCPPPLCKIVWSKNTLELSIFITAAGIFSVTIDTLVCFWSTWLLFSKLHKRLYNSSRNIFLALAFLDRCSNSTSKKGHGRLSCQQKDSLSDFVQNVVNVKLILFMLTYIHTFWGAFCFGSAVQNCLTCLRQDRVNKVNYGLSLFSQNRSPRWPSR